MVQLTSYANDLARVGLTGVLECLVPRQVTLAPTDADAVIPATLTGIEYERAQGVFRLVLTGAMRHCMMLKYLELVEFGGKQVWEAHFHDPHEPTFFTRISFGHTIGSAL